MRVSDTLNTIIILRCVKIIIPTVLTEIHIKNRQIEIFSIVIFDEKYKLKSVSRDTQKIEIRPLIA